MKIIEFRKLIREEVKKVMKEALVTDTIVLVISYNANGDGTFYKSSTFQGPYKGPKIFNIKTIKTGKPEDKFQIIPAMSLKSFSIQIRLIPGQEQEVYDRAVKMLDAWFKTTKNDAVVYNDQAGTVVTFKNANDLKKQITNTMKANWTTVWAAKSPKFNLQ